MDKIMKIKNNIGIIIGFIFLIGCQTIYSPTPQKINDDIIIEDFEKININTSITVHNGSMKLINNNHLGIQNKALEININTGRNPSSSLTIKPKKPWDWSIFKDFHLAFDVKNTGTESVQINLDIQDQNGDSYSRAFIAATHEQNTWYAKMDGHDQFDPLNARKNEFNFSSGFRSNPPTWESQDKQVFSLWGKKRLDLRGIHSIQFSVSGATSDRTFILDNIRLRPNPEMNPHFITGLLDQYGQNTRINYPGKVHSNKDLINRRNTELANLKSATQPSRSQFSGWKDGPRLRATGYFRTQKIDGKWWLVDPEGYLYLSTGIDILRLSNSSTLTGYDFDQKYIPKRDETLLISEDDQPLNRITDNALPSRHLASPARERIFTWLPEYNEPLGKHYGYRRETQSGPLKHGETFSFYSANLERKYSDDSKKPYLDTWREVTIDRMLNWGFTSLGNWAQEEYYSNQKIPFVAFADIIGEFGTLSSGFDFWHGVPDPWDPRFEERAKVAVRGVAKQINSSPWAMGIFLDNEQSFGRPESHETHYGIVIHTLAEDAKGTHAKAVFTKMMKQQYVSIQNLNASWGKAIPSWKDFEKGIDASLQTDAQLADYSKMLTAYGDQYFGTAKRALKSILPNHLYLGSRLPTWGMPIEIVEAAGRHMDIITFNVYEEGLTASKWDFLKEIDAPALIGEFSFGSDDAGHVHPGIVIAANQKDRAHKFKNYMYSVIDHPNFVGAHMFQYMDSPISGRAYDGENYNNGIVSVTDTPYEPLVKAAKEIGAELYQRRYHSALD